MTPSNDTSSCVQEEIEAAEVSLLEFVPTQYLQGYNDHIFNADPPIHVGIEWRAGWLASEMDSVVADMADPGWEWDASRPLEGQFEEWCNAHKRGLQ